MPLHFQEGKAVERLVPASTKTVKVMGPQSVPDATLHDVLAHLARQGAFAALPSTATETAEGGRPTPPGKTIAGPSAPFSVDLWQALAHLGDGAWLAGHEGFDRDDAANARRWIERFLRGLAVPARADGRPSGVADAVSAKAG